MLKKFHGKFLPKGVLRDRHKAIMERWNSGEDHGGVTVEELKTLLDDWKGTPREAPAAAQGVGPKSRREVKRIDLPADVGNRCRFAHPDGE